MLYSEIIAVCSQIHRKHINTLCGQSVDLWMLNLAVYIVTTGSQSVTVGEFPWVGTHSSAVIEPSEISVELLCQSALQRCPHIFLNVFDSQKTSFL
jgi:hypothetical protein